jgi:GTP cyclohydrolase II
MDKGSKISNIGPIKLPITIGQEYFGWFQLRLFQSNSSYYLCLEKGMGGAKSLPALVRIESACTFAHLFGSQKCDCEWQLKEAMRQISKEGSGLVIYCHEQHGRGVGLWNHVRVYIEEERGLSTAQAHSTLGLPVDGRHYEDVANILASYGLRKIRLLTNNPQRLAYLRAQGIEVNRLPLQAPVSVFNEKELIEKKRDLGHLLSLLTPEEWQARLNQLRLGPKDTPCIIVRGLTEVIGEGHSELGASQSIKQALDAAGAKARGASLHAFEIPSDTALTELVHQSGIRRVVAGHINETAAKIWKEAGVEVVACGHSTTHGQ